jgi:hypothetical protein
LPRQQKRDGKNFQLNGRKPQGNTLPRRVAETTAGCHDEIADTKSIYYTRRTPHPTLFKKNKNRKEKPKKPGT